VSLNLRTRLEALPNRRCADRSHSLRLAHLATFGFVLELLIVEEQLFASGKNEICPAVDAL
jgi:hypothetical protein